MAGTASIVIRGDVRQALAVLDALGVKAEEVGKRTEHAFGSAATSTGNIFQKLGQAAGNWGVPFSSLLSKMGDKLAETETKGQKAFQALSTVGGATLLAVGAGAIAAGVEAVKMAGNFESASEHLVTDAGLAQGSLSGVEKGMLAISAATGTSSSSIVDGMYHIQSGLHLGATGLGVLKAAAEGAKVGNADLDTVSKTLSGTLASYYGNTINAGNATKLATGMMNQLIATVGAGDMRMEDLATSLGNVTPIAAAAGLSFAQVGGAIATMTSQNMSAQQATQDLANLIRNLQAPNAVAAKEMAQLGVNSATLAQNLGKKGLTGTLGDLMGAIAKQTSGGQVILNSFNQTQAGAADMRTELSKMAPAARQIAEAFAAGKINVSQYRQEVRAMPADQQVMLTGFLSTYDATNRFSDQLRSGLNANQTFTQALEKMTGGATGLNTALMLTGTNAAVFQSNVDTVAASAKQAGANVDNWGAIQKTFNQQIDQARVTVEDLGIKYGMFLIPKLQEAEKDTAAVVNWFEKHKAVAEALGITIGTVLSGAVAVFTINKLAGMVKATRSAIDELKNFGQAAGGVISKLTGIGGGQTALDGAGKQAGGALNSAAGSLDGAAGRLTTAAQQISAAADRLAGAGTSAGSKLEAAGTTTATELETGAATAAKELETGGAITRGEESIPGVGIPAGAKAASKAKTVLRGGAHLLGSLTTAGATIYAGQQALQYYGGLSTDAGKVGPLNFGPYGMPNASLSVLTPQQMAEYLSLSAAGKLPKGMTPAQFAKTMANMPPVQGAVMTPGPVHRALGGGIAAGQWAIVGEKGPELAQFNLPTMIYPNTASIARTVSSITGTPPASSLTASEAGMLAKLAGPTYNIETLQVVANDPAQFEAQVQQKARLGNLAGGSMRSR